MHWRHAVRGHRVHTETAQFRPILREVRQATCTERSIALIEPDTVGACKDIRGTAGIEMPDHQATLRRTAESLLNALDW